MKTTNKLASMILILLAAWLAAGTARGVVADEYALRHALQYQNDPVDVAWNFAVDMWAGNRAVTGLALEDGLGTDNGVVRVYQRDSSNGRWYQLGGDIRPPADALQHGDGCKFGSAVAISGAALAIAAERDEIVYLYRWLNNEWVPDGRVGIGLPGWVHPIGLSYGSSLDVDGDRLLVGARTDIADAARSGRAYVYKRNSAVNPPQWDLEQRLDPPVQNRRGDFGCAVSLSGDRALVGCIKGDAALSSGDAFVFRRSANNAWSLEAALPHAREQNDSFGQSVQISGTMAMVGSRGSKTVHFFAYVNGRWQETDSFRDLFSAKSVSLGAGGRAAAVDLGFTGTDVATYKLEGGRWISTGSFSTPQYVRLNNQARINNYVDAVAVENNALLVACSFLQPAAAGWNDAAYIYDLRTEQTAAFPNLLGSRTLDWFSAAVGSPIGYWVDVTWDPRVPMNLRSARVELWDIRLMTSVVCRDIRSDARNRGSVSGEYIPTAGNMPHRFVVSSRAAGWPANLPGPTVTIRYRYLWGSR